MLESLVGNSDAYLKITYINNKLSFTSTEKE